VLSSSGRDIGEVLGQLFRGARDAFVLSKRNSKSFTGVYFGRYVLIKVCQRRVVVENIVRLSVDALPGEFNAATVSLHCGHYTMRDVRIKNVDDDGSERDTDSDPEDACPPENSSTKSAEDDEVRDQ